MRNVPPARNHFAAKGYVLSLESENLKLAKSRVGRKAQVGAGLAIFLRVLLRVATPSATAGAPIDIH
jgi:hypothetical protein